MLDAAPIAFLVSLTIGISYFFSSARVIEQGSEGIVERLGRFHTTLEPGLRFIIPFVDTLIVESVRERTTDVARQKVITKDALSIDVDAIVYWRIDDVEKSYYNIDDVEEALRNLVLAEIRAQFGQLELTETFSQIETTNAMLLRRLEAVTATWGITVLRVVIQEITRSDEIRRATERVLLAESERQASLEEAEGKREAAIAESEGRKQSAIAEAEGIVQAVQLISSALQGRPENQAVLQQVVQFLVAQRYVDANQQLSTSDNAKVVFMDPRALSEAVSDLIYDGDPSKLRRTITAASEAPPPSDSPDLPPPAA